MRLQIIGAVLVAFLATPGMARGDGGGGGGGAREFAGRGGPMEVSRDQSSRSEARTTCSCTMIVPRDPDPGQSVTSPAPRVPGESATDRRIDEHH
jgi:hypothetical protein